MGLVEGNLTEKVFSFLDQGEVLVTYFTQKV